MVSTRFLRQAAFASLMALLMASVVEAQQGGGDQPPQNGGGRQRGGPGGGRGGFGGFGGGVFAPRVDRAALLGAEKVRLELKIEETQAATIDAALEAYREERNASPRPDFQNMSEDERTAYFAESQKKREELSKKTDEILGALLEPVQAKRLDEIAMQIRMNSAALQTLKSDDVKGKLSLTEAQLTSLTEVETAAAAEGQKMFEELRAAGEAARAAGGAQDGAAGGGRGGAGFEQMREKMDAMRKKTTESAMAVLTDEQKATLASLQGEPTKIEARDLMPRGFGGQGGGRTGDGGRQGGGRGTRPPTE